MSKPRIEKASDVNGGQYIPHNHAYNNGYEDGKKAGKEYCASEITTLREQVEKLEKERDEYRMKYQLKADKADTYGRESSKCAETIESATGFALNTANYLHRCFFSDVTQWKPLDDLIGLQTQISNMVTGIGEQLAALADLARAEENEACAKVCEAQEGDDELKAIAKGCAMAIRARRK